MAESDPGLLAQLLGRAAYEFSQAQPMLPVYLHLVVSALFPIYTGAHASLSRPSTAAKPDKKKRVTGDGAGQDSDDDDDEEEERLMEGLSPRDAILMPLFAGCALASLYFLLTWMKDPALLNKCLNAYFAIFGVFSVSRLVADVLAIVCSLVLPHRYVLGGALYHVNGRQEKAVPVAGDTQGKQPVVSPLPGFLTKLPLSARLGKHLWAVRALVYDKWTLKLHLQRAPAGTFRFGLPAIAGVVVGLGTVAYFNLVDKPWYLTNLLGFGFSYSALQLMSPTTFATGSLILSALFFYDIYFVFYTPMMVTVAKSLDVPIKLMFPRPAAADDLSGVPTHAMLGLGDIVLPGIIVGLALRFDLYLFYLRRQRHIPSPNLLLDDIVVKPQYFSLAGRWSDHIWTHSFFGKPLWVATTAKDSKPEAPFTFPKTYFTAAMVGYILGLLATLGVMMIWNHAQPALLYLVPGVLGSLWLTALVRGEIGLMWDYTEDIAENDEDKDEKSDEKKSDSATKKTGTGSKKDKDGKESDKKRVVSHRPEHEIFSFSIEAPWKLKDLKNTPKGEEKATKSSEGDEKHNWAPAAKHTTSTEQEGKRVRLK